MADWGLLKRVILKGSVSSQRLLDRKSAAQSASLLAHSLHWAASDLLTQHMQIPAVNSKHIDLGRAEQGRAGQGRPHTLAPLVNLSESA